jgi:hypothetical protein
MGKREVRGDGEGEFPPLDKILLANQGSDPSPLIKKPKTLEAIAKTKPWATSFCWGMSAKTITA